QEVNPSEAEILRVHQLAPELSETISHFESVIFVDAAESGAATDVSVQGVRLRGQECPLHTGLTITTREIAPDSSGKHFSHYLTPSAVVTLAAELYGSTPQAISVTLTGHQFGHSQSLTPSVEQALPKLVSIVKKLIRANGLCSGLAPSKTTV